MSSASSGPSYAGAEHCFHLCVHCEVSQTRLNPSYLSPCYFPPTASSVLPFFFFPVLPSLGWHIFKQILGIHP